MPTEDSATTVRGDVPSSEPMTIQIPSMHRVIRRRGKRALSSMKPEGQAGQQSNRVSELRNHFFVVWLQQTLQDSKELMGKPE